MEKVAAYDAAAAAAHHAALGPPRCVAGRTPPINSCTFTLYFASWSGMQRSGGGGGGGGTGVVQGGAEKAILGPWVSREI